MPESRQAVGEALEGALLAMVRSSDSRRSAFARLLLLSWNIGLGSSEVKRDAREWWLDWADALVASNVEELLEPEHVDPEILGVAFTRGYLGLQEYFERTGTRSDEPILNPLFRMQRNAILGYAYAPWVHTGLMSLRPLSPGAPSRMTRRRRSRARDLNELGAMLVPDLPLPWLSITRFGAVRYLDVPWQPDFEDEDALWALWILLACCIENLAHARMDADLRSKVGNDLIWDILAGRENGAGSCGVFEGTAFGIFQGDRRTMLENWTAGRLNLVASEVERGRRGLAAGMADH